MSILRVKEALWTLSKFHTLDSSYNEFSQRFQEIKPNREVSGLTLQIYRYIMSKKFYILLNIKLLRKSYG